MYTLHQRATILRDTLKRVEESAGLKPDDLALIELKRVILSKVIELEHQDAALSVLRAQLSDHQMPLP